MMQADTPITLANVSTMSEAEHEALIEAIRERRLQPVREYEKLTLMQAQAKKAGLETQYAKVQEMFLKELERADKAIVKVEARSRKMRAMMMEIEEL